MNILPAGDVFSGTLMQPVRCDSRAVCFAIVVQLTDGRGDWSTDGCNLTGYNETTDVVGCECDHLTNFACLVVRPM